MRRKEYLPIGKDARFNVYHDMYDRLRLASQILNAGNRNVGIHFMIWDKVNVETQIRRMTGDENGQFLEKNGNGHLASIPAQEQRLADLEHQFQSFQRRKIREGHARPKDWPPDLLRQRLEAEARLDVLNEELEQLQKWLTHFTEPIQKAQDDHVLEYGLRCSGRLRNGGLAEIDGQACGYIGDVLCIIDEKSPYNSISITDYRKLSAEWLAERRKRDAEKLKLLQEQARAEGLSGPKSFASPVRKVDKSSLPKWPIWARNYVADPPEVLEKKNENEE